MQKVNRRTHLAAWSQSVEACCNSGMPVAKWCAEQGIPVSTYYTWQKKVLQALNTDKNICFAELSIPQQLNSPAATIVSGELRIDIHHGADSEIIFAMVRALNNDDRFYRSR